MAVRHGIDCCFDVNMSISPAISVPGTSTVDFGGAGTASPWYPQTTQYVPSVPVSRSFLVYSDDVAVYEYDRKDRCSVRNV